MNSPRQRPISVTSQEHEALKSQKRLYEDATGDTGDWGKFLRTVTILGLTAIGVHRLTKAIERSKQSVNVKCPNCDGVFALALPGEQTRFVYVLCPLCDNDLVVDVGATTVSIQNGYKPFAEWPAECPHCGYDNRVIFVSRPPYRGEQMPVTCHECGKEFLVSSHQVHETGFHDLEL